MALFSRRDWNIVVITSEGPERMRLNANRQKGRQAAAAKKGAASHGGTLCWVVFDQEGRKLDEGLGPASARLDPEQAKRMLTSLPTNRTVLEVLRELERGRDRMAKEFTWQDRGQDREMMGF
jgi:hypothetical protein